MGTSGVDGRFADRAEAGRRLAEVVAALGLVDPVVLALPRGGVPVGHEVAARLGVPLEVVVVRKVGAPGQPELGVGAVAEGGLTVRDDEALRLVGVTATRFAGMAAAERAEVDRRVQRYRGGRALPPLDGRDVVLVDDGLATGVTAEAALVTLRACRAGRLVLAAPACAADTAVRLRALAEVVWVSRRADFVAVGRWYREFPQVTDDEVLALLRRLPGGEP